MKFANASRDELWINGARVESRLSHGVAVDEADRIVASDDYDEELVHSCDEAIASLRKSVVEDVRMRLVASARRVRGVVMTESTITTTKNGVSIVGTTFPTFPPLLSGAAVPPPPQPIVWRNGSASVLLHAAIGHASEHNAPRIAWPSWLTVHDEPNFPIDDTGNETRRVDLMQEPPACFRRESFRDIPLRRMTNVVVRGEKQYEVKDAIEVHLVKGGSYDPLTDIVTIDIAVSSIGPFTIRKTRAEIAASIVGASGDPIAYPGVICSREGQELVVGSHAPTMVTR